MLADNNACHASGGNHFVVFFKGDFAIVVAGQTACIAADGSPVGDALVNRVVGVRNVACAVFNGRVFLIGAADAADIRIISRNNTGVDAVFNRRIAFILANDAADIGIANDIACVDSRFGAAIAEQCRLRVGLGQRTDDAADILAAENITVCLGFAVIQHALYAVADNTADIFAAQLVLIRLRIGIAIRITGTALALGKRCVIRVADNAADIMSGQRILGCGCAAED